MPPAIESPPRWRSSAMPAVVARRHLQGGRRADSGCYRPRDHGQSSPPRQASYDRVSHHPRPARSPSASPADWRSGPRRRADSEPVVHHGRGAGNDRAVRHELFVAQRIEFCMIADPRPWSTGDPPECPTMSCLPRMRCGASARWPRASRSARGVSGITMLAPRTAVPAPSVVDKDRVPGCRFHVAGDRARRTRTRRRQSRSGCPQCAFDARERQPADDRTGARISLPSGPACPSPGHVGRTAMN